jgi:hypothetical protein
LRHKRIEVPSDDYDVVVRAIDRIEQVVDLPEPAGRGCPVLQVHVIDADVDP